MAGARLPFRKSMCAYWGDGTKNSRDTSLFRDSPIKSHVKNYVPSVAYSKIYRYLVDYEKEIIKIFSGIFLTNFSK